MEEEEIVKSSKDLKAEHAVNVATRQLITSTEFKKPRLNRLARYWKLYDNDTSRKLRQLFNVPIPVFPGMIDTLNAQYNEPINLEFGEGDPSDYFKVQKINGAFQREITSTAGNNKWNSKLRMARKHAIMNGRPILKYTSESDPEYKTNLDVVNLKYFHFQPRGGNDLEKHLFAGEENIDKTLTQLKRGVQLGTYDKNQVDKIIKTGSRTTYLPESGFDIEDRLSRFRPLGLDADNHNYVGQNIYKFAQWVLNIGGERYLLVFQPWTQTWIRFEKWKDVDSSGLYPWHTYATHEDDENFLSKSFADDLYPSADAIVAMFNQELTNREKRNFGARAYDKDMFKDVRKLDESMSRPDALVPGDTNGGTKRLSEGIYEFKTGELNGTVNLIDWITDTVGNSTGANELAKGGAQPVSKKASVTFAEQKAISKRIGWAAEPYQEMLAGLGMSFVWGLKDHMPSKMAIRLLGENGADWEDITRLDLSTKRDIDITITSTDKQLAENERKSEKRTEALTLLAGSTNINSKKRDEEILKNAEYTDQEIAEFMDTKTFSDKKSLARASIAIQDILRSKKPELWYGATPAFMQKLVDYATDHRDTLKEKHQEMLDHALAHKDIAATNVERRANEQALEMNQRDLQAGLNTPPTTQSDNPGVPGGVSRALETANAAIQ